MATGILTRIKALKRLSRMRTRQLAVWDKYIKSVVAEQRKNRKNSSDNSGNTGNYSNQEYKSFDKYLSSVSSTSNFYFSFPGYVISIRDGINDSLTLKLIEGFVPVGWFLFRVFQFVVSYKVFLFKKAQDGIAIIIKQVRISVQDSVYPKRNFHKLNF